MKNSILSLSVLALISLTSFNAVAGDGPGNAGGQQTPSQKIMQLSTYKSYFSDLAKALKLAKGALKCGGLDGQLDSGAGLYTGTVTCVAKAKDETEIKTSVKILAAYNEAENNNSTVAFIISMNMGEDSTIFNRNQ